MAFFFVSHTAPDALIVRGTWIPMHHESSKPKLCLQSVIRVSGRDQESRNTSDWSILLNADTSSPSSRFFLFRSRCKCLATVHQSVCLLFVAETIYVHQQWSDCSISAGHRRIITWNKIFRRLCRLAAVPSGDGWLIDLFYISGIRQWIHVSTPLHTLFLR